MTPRTMADVKRANKASGHYWFSRSTMDFFACQIETELVGGRMFVTSEKSPYGPRAYTVREAVDGGTEISTVGEFQEHATLEDATRAMHAALGARR